ncbi:hypothetical protein ACFP3U_23675 [Kitasatospora misakiensis]|uniref:Uncharacterized protein n=1 Tax=Kitasatospora misakiensis TaxID=67330 RepID=A0ABW0X9J7_9ACTN
MTRTLILLNGSGVSLRWRSWAWFSSVGMVVRWSCPRASRLNGGEESAG